MRSARTSGGAAVALVGALLLVLGLAFATTAHGEVAVRDTAPATGDVYLALGDSLAASFQPKGDQHSGYAEQVFQLEQAANQDLRLVKLGCPGERTNTIDRPRRLCQYAEGTQLDQAVAVLEDQDVAFVTLQIGSNDLFSCFRFGQGVFDQTCVDERLPKVVDRLGSIVETLRSADPEVSIVGMTYLNPLLALWTAPGFPQDLVVQDADVWHTINDALAQTYAGLGVPVADVEAAFSTSDFDTIVHTRGFGDLPLNVARVCQWSHMCATQGDDAHPNTIGYAAITRAVETALATI
jgi:lysophospholipase L1-like esterase